MILFVCEGNVCRSQMAEAFYNQRSNGAMSAGTDPKTPAKYPNMLDPVVSVMAQEGIDISSHKVKTVDEQMVRNADRIIVMCNRKFCPDFVLGSSKVEFWEIEDPFDKDLDFMEKTKDIVKENVLSLIDK